jgi:type IV secretory pathway VirJ component
MKWATLARTPQPRRGLAALLALLVVWKAEGVKPLRAQTTAGDGASVAALPLHEVRVDSTGHQLVFLITGDGGYAAGDRGIAETFADHGVPVVALDARAYLAKKRLPDEVASDAERIMRHYLAAWHRDSVIFVGYSRGADMAPFILTRLPADVRSRLSLVAMIGLAERASFEFHWSDLVMDTKRSSDYPVEPEVLKVHGVRMLCLYGEHEKHSLCPTFASSVLQADQHGGKHALSKTDGADVAQRILRELESAKTSGIR